MKKVFLIMILTFVSFLAIPQQTDYNIQKKAVAAGYDVVAYFNNEAVKGNKKFSTSYENATFRFSSKENLTAFLNSPEKYIPQYGGYCAYAIGVKGEKVSIDPETFEIRDQKLYLFYNAWGTNTLELWLKENPDVLKQKADKNWVSLK